MPKDFENHEDDFQKVDYDEVDLDDEAGLDEDLEDTEHLDPEEADKQKPWAARFLDNESGRGKQYSRSLRNQPAKEATTLSKVLLGIFVILLVIPFSIFIIVDANRSNDNLPARTAEQVMISKSSESKVQSQESVDESESKAADESEGSQESDNQAQSESVSSRSIESQRQISSQPEVQSTPPEPEPSYQEPPAPPTQAGGSYTVSAGETWYGIARNFGIDVYTLLDMNGATVDTPLYPGQVIVTP